MRCPRCQHENPAEAKFCGNCRAPTEAESVCPACRTANPPANRFCHACGEPLTAGRAPAQYASPRSYTPAHLAETILTSRVALEGERKQVTVLFCDMTNSTGLAERIGPEAMHALLSRFFDFALGEIHRYEGTVNQFLGDGLMALFGAPIAREDHAQRAVRAALAIQDGLGQALADAAPDLDDALSVRLGLHTGLVVVGSIGDNLRMDYTAVGDTTNLAARLLQLAEPGEILVSDATRSLLSDEVHVEPRGPLAVKGKAEPVVAHRVVGLGPRRGLQAGRGDLTRFLDRKRELQILRHLLAQALGGRGQVVGLVGVPGVGRSRLLREFAGTLSPEKVTYLEGRCVSYESGVPYQPVVDLLRENCHITEADGPDVIIQKVRLSLREVEMDPDQEAPSLLHLLEVEAGPGPAGTLTPEAVQARTRETLHQMTLRGSRKRPLVMAIEDLHWIDQVSEEYLAMLVESLGGAPILLLVTYRPGYTPAWLDKSYATQLALQPLSPEDGAALVRAAVGSHALTADELQTVVDAGEGNPFFLEELARGALEPGERANAAMPPAIQAAVTAWIDRLPEDTKRALQTAAVLGREFPLSVLEAVWDGPGVLEPHLVELKRLEFLDERVGSGEPTYVFRHALTRAVASESLLASRREALQAAAAQAAGQPRERPAGPEPARRVPPG